MKGRTVVGRQPPSSHGLPDAVPAGSQRGLKAWPSSPCSLLLLPPLLQEPPGVHLDPPLPGPTSVSLSSIPPPAAVTLSPCHASPWAQTPPQLGPCRSLLSRGGHQDRPRLLLKPSRAAWCSEFRNPHCSPLPSATCRHAAPTNSPTAHQVLLSLGPLPGVPSPAQGSSWEVPQRGPLASPQRAQAVALCDPAQCVPARPPPSVRSSVSRLCSTSTSPTGCALPERRDAGAPLPCLVLAGRRLFTE